MRFFVKGGKHSCRLWSIKPANVLIAAVVIVALAAAAFIGLRENSSTANANVIYQVASLKTGTLKKTVSGSGTLEAASETPVLAPVALSVTSVRKAEGESVREGDVIADIDVSTLGAAVSVLQSEIDALDRRIASLHSDDDAANTVTAPVSGRVKQIYANPDDDVAAVLARSGALIVLSTDGKLRFDFTPSSVADAPSVGETLRVRVPDAGTYDGTVEDVSPEQGTVTVTITDDGPEAGATATAFRGETALGSGELAANQPVTVTAAGGTVESVYVNENEKVYRGSALLHIEKRPDSEDYKSLTAQRSQEAAKLAYARQILNAGALVAPGDGIIISSVLKMNLPVRAGAAMFTLSSDSALVLRAAVDELDIVSVSEGQDATVSVDAVPNKRYKGTVQSLSRVGEAANGVTTYDVHIAVDGDDALRIGMNATAGIIAEERACVLMVPVSALQDRGAEEYVWVYTGALPDDPAQDPGKRTAVKTGLSNGTYAEVTEGLGANDQVVIVTEKYDSDGTFINRMNGVSGQQPDATTGASGSGPASD